MSNIVVIEDEPAIRDLLVGAVRFLGHEVRSAADGASGLGLIRESLPDLVLCDVRMPGMGGYEVLAAMRADPRMATVSLIFLTGQSDRSDVRRGMELGADDYLSKPFTVQELQGSIRACLDKRRQIEAEKESQLAELRRSISLALPHELLTPLNGIQGFASVILEEGAAMSKEEMLDCVRNIDVSARRLHRLVESFLVHTQLELMEVDPRRRESLRSQPPFALGSMLGEVASVEAGRAGRSEDLELAVGEGSVTMHPEYAGHLFRPLVENAFKFSVAGTRVKVRGAREDGVYRAEIQDGGRGMSADQLRSIGAHMQFDRQVHEQQGAGLGLVIARRLTELHGGRFEVASVPGEGTTVTVSLPAAGE